MLTFVNHLEGLTIFTTEAQCSQCILNTTMNIIKPSRLAKVNTFLPPLAYSYRCLKIETADEIGTRANHTFQNEYLERFLSNYLLQIIIYFEIRVPNF